MWFKQALVLVIIFSVFPPIISQRFRTCNNTKWQNWKYVRNCITTTTGNIGTNGTNILNVGTDTYGDPATDTITTTTNIYSNPAIDGINTATDTYGNPTTGETNTATDENDNTVTETNTITVENVTSNTITAGCNTAAKKCVRLYRNCGHTILCSTWNYTRRYNTSARLGRDVFITQDDIPVTTKSILTNDPNNVLSPDSYSMPTTLNNDKENSAGLIVVVNNETFSGQIPSVSPTDETSNSMNESSVKPIISASAGENGDLLTVPNTVTVYTDLSDGSVTDGTPEFSPYDPNSNNATFDSVTEVSTNIDGNNYSDGELKQNYADIFNVSSDTLSDVHRIHRGACGLSNGGPLIQPAIPPVTSRSNSLVWSVKYKALYLVDGMKPVLLKYTPSNGKLVTLTLDGTLVQTILPTSIKNQFVVELDHRLVLLENSFSKDESVTTYKKVLVVFNSIHSLGVAKTDLQGRLWIPVRVRASNNEIIDQLYLISKGQAVHKDTFRKIKGMAWSPNNKYFYVADSENGGGLVYVYAFNYKTATIENRTILFNLNDYRELSGQITNIAVDNNGDVWASIYNESLIIKIDHTSGKLLEIIPLPTNYPVSLAFGDDKQNILFVGTAYNNSRKTDVPYVYTISELNVKGNGATKEIKLKEIFGSTTMNITVTNGGVAPVIDSPSLNTTTCSAIKELLEIKERRTNRCTIVKDTPIVQEAIAPIETTGSSLYWNYETNAMYFADMDAPSVIKYSPYNGKTVTVKLENITTVTSIIPIKHKHHNYILSTDNFIVQFKNEFKENSMVQVNGKVIAKLKDTNIIFSRARTDCRGRLWIGTKYMKPTRTKCKLYMLEKGKLVSKISDVIASGGMTWSLDNKHFYFADSGEGKIYSYDFNEWSGAIRNRMVFFDIAKEPMLNGTIEDLTIDRKNNIWATVFSDSVVIRLNRTTGSVEQMISLPIKYPVSLEFGGEARDTLFVASALGGSCKVEGMPSTYAISNLPVRGTDANYNYVL